MDVEQQLDEFEGDSMQVQPLESEKIDKRSTLVMILALLALLAIPRAALGQQVRKVFHVGVLETISEVSNAASFDAFRRGLRER